MSTTNTNTESFINSFISIESRLREITGLGKENTFATLLKSSSQKDSIVRRHFIDLQKFAELRNIIVHERAGGQIIAEPNIWAVERIHIIAKQLLQPPRVDSHFANNVFTLALNDSISKAITVMQAESFSQIPIYQSLQFSGLLTADTINRWLGANINAELADLKETQIAEVLKHTESEKHVQFVSRHTNLAEIIEIFHTQEQDGVRLEALLITHSGRQTERPLGIITIYDLVRINKLLAV